MKKEYLYRWLIYIIGLLILALGITLNTKVSLGVSPIISVSYSISSIWNLNFGDMTLVLYGVFVLIEMVLHVMRNRKYTQNGGVVLAHANQVNMKKVLLMDILQFPLSLVFTRFMNLFVRIIPDFKTAFEGSFAGSIGGRLLLLLAAIVLTGIGAAMSLSMRIVPNPGDGIVQAIADCSGKGVGLCKNCFDLLNILITITVGLVFAGGLVGIGLGTVIAVIGVGRVIAGFNHVFYEKMTEAAGIF